MEIFGLILMMLVIFGLSVSVLWTEFKGAPWIPTPRWQVKRMLDLAEVSSEDTLYDCGCGDGRLILMAARKYGANAVGIEIDPLRYFYCQFLVTFWGLRNQVKVIHGNIFDADLSDATVVTCYLRQRTNNKLEEKLMRELTPGTRVVSNTFIFPTVPAVGGDDQIRLYYFYPDKDQGLKNIIENSESQ